MIKYIKDMTTVVFEEIPDKISVAINIANCQHNCIGCHSAFLKEDIGDELNESEIDLIMKNNEGINCVLFMGEGNDIPRLIELNNYVKKTYNIETGIYSGSEKVPSDYFKLFDYVKFGPYISKFGPLNCKTTNQRMLYHGTDITNKFWRT